LARYLIRPLSGSQNPPWFDARGIAIGLAIGFGLPVGTQIAALGILRAAFRFNVLAAFAFTWVNNPLTIIPMYYGYYYFGSLILGKPVALTAEAFRALMAPIINSGYAWDSLYAFTYLGGEILVRWAVAAAIVGTVSGVLGYLVGLHIQKGHCRRRARELGLTYEKLLQDLESSLPKQTEERSYE